MLYPTLTQPYVVVCMLFTGILSGIIFDFFRFLTYLSKNDKYSLHFFDFLAVLLSFFIYFFTSLHTNYGQFRLYTIAIFLLGIFLEKIILKFLWTKLVLRWYNIFAVKLQRRTKGGRQKKNIN